MGKRMTDTAIWEKEWFMELAPAEKCAVMLIKDRCDAVGVWSVNFTLAEMFIGEKIDWEGLVKKSNGNIEILSDKKWWLVDFCSFQYRPLDESTTVKPEQSYITLLKKHGLWERYTKGIHAGQEKIRIDKKKKRKETPESETTKSEATDLLAFLNKSKLELTGKVGMYRDAEPIRKALGRRGVTADQIRELILNQLTNSWMREHPQHFNPETLMRPSHFDIYLNTDYSENGKKQTGTPPESGSRGDVPDYEDG